MADEHRSMLLHKVWRHRHSIYPILWGQALAILGMVVGTRVLTEVVSPATFGEVKLIQGAAALATGLAIRPLAQFAMREFHDAERDGLSAEFECYARGLQLRSGAVIAVLLVAGLATFGAVTGQVSLAGSVVAGGYIIAEALLSLDASFALTKNRQALNSAIETARQWGLPLSAAAVVLLWGQSAAWFVLAQTALTGACFFLLRWRLPVAPAERTVDVTPWRRGALTFALPMLAAGFFNWVMNLGDRYVIAQYCSIEDLGRYAAVYGLVSAPIVTAGGMMSRALFPLVFRAAALRAEESQARMLRLMGLLSAIIGLCAVATVALIGDQIAMLVLAAPYRVGAKPLMIWLAAGHACLIVAFSLDLKGMARKSTVPFTIATGLGGLVNILLNVIWVPHEGVLGAAKSTFVSLLAYLLSIAFLLRKSNDSARGEQPAPG